MFTVQRCSCCIIVILVVVVVVVVVAAVVVIIIIRTENSCHVWCVCVCMWQFTQFLRILWGVNFQGILHCEWHTQWHCVPVRFVRQAVVISSATGRYLQSNTRTVYNIFFVIYICTARSVCSVEFCTERNRIRVYLHRALYLRWRLRISNIRNVMFALCTLVCKLIFIMLHSQ